MRKALMDHQVLFIRDQSLRSKQLKPLLCALANFGIEPSFKPNGPITPCGP